MYVHFQENNCAFTICTVHTMCTVENDSGVIVEEIFISHECKCQFCTVNGLQKLRVSLLKQLSIIISIARSGYRYSIDRLNADHHAGP
jgi:hypothetical protein